MELRAHGVVVVARHGTDQGSVLPIPYSDGLIIRAGQDPWQLVVKKYRSYVVQVAIKSKKAASSLIGPDLDLVIIPAGYEERLCLVEVNTPDWAVVFLESIDQRSHAVIP